MPEVAAFLNSHHEFGTPTTTQDVPNWAKGKRQRVNFDSGQSLLFYMKDGEVVTVYEDHPSEGRKKVWGEYDQPEVPKPVDRPPTDELPAYRVLFSAQKLGGGKFGDVLIPSLSRTTASSEREAIARRIAQQEGLTEISIYSSEEAYKANTSASYSKQHPGALKKGFLGSIRDGQFTPGESVFP